MISTMIVDFNGEALTIIDGEKQRHSSKAHAEDLANLKKISFGIIFDHGNAMTLINGIKGKSP